MEELLYETSFVLPFDSCGDRMLPDRPGVLLAQIVLFVGIAFRPYAIGEYRDFDGCRQFGIERFRQPERDLRRGGYRQQLRRHPLF